MSHKRHYVNLVILAKGALNFLSSPRMGGGRSLCRFLEGGLTRRYWRCLEQSTNFERHGMGTGALAQLP